MIHIWTDEHFTRIETLCREGLSANEIAKRVSVEWGEAITRNSIIGKLHRKGLRTKKPRPVSTDAINKRRRHRANPEREIKLKPAIALMPPSDRSLPKMSDLERSQSALALAEQRMEFDRARASTGISIFDVKWNDERCRWPMNDVDPIHDFRFCGKFSNGRVYCREHHIRAHSSLMCVAEAAE